MANNVILFDLDGTLVDTAPDFEATINAVRASLNMSALALSEILPMINHGAVAMTQLAFSVREIDEDFNDLKQKFLDQYTHNIGKHSRVYTGLHELLARFEHERQPWGIATNKPRKYAERYLGFLPAQPTLLICGDDVEKPKPDPMMLYKAAEMLSLPPSKVGYVGDHERDIIAAKAAGMFSIAASYGYMCQNECASHWQADIIAKSSKELAEFIYSYTGISKRF
ncbi:HAD-IA family hydrolase [Simiduia curdlanivorans]|uniref:HAD family hydrolase n=1 Tax=Simiduia curdlanivorans TaxID=1492769 RepID=A0ABV8V9C2_9GAMM|nr:HAD-IA family hydrolase [Simiduia curdlanivorans]MDN3639889.1 HAD-IA family hydrolase [Simiduia curdlanivorans]MDN3639912.1 HAD-IA family hydrolase [Simiduia curdlanivorans]